MKVWRLDSSTFDVACSQLFLTQKAAEREEAYLHEKWKGCQTFVTECEDIWHWSDEHMHLLIENLFEDYTHHTDESGWRYIIIESSVLYNSLEKLFDNTELIDDYSILMECVSSTDEGQLYALAISWYFDGELNHMMEFVVI